MTNGERAAAGIGPLSMRADVVPMAMSHSIEMAQQGSIWHGSFVTESTLHALNAQSIGENVGMGGDLDSIESAFMASEHHRDNILDPNFTQVGMAVVVNDGTYFVTEDFVQPKAGKPASVSRPVAPRRSTSGYVTVKAPGAVAPKPKAGGPPASVLSAARPPDPAPEPKGTVNAVAFDDQAAPVAAPATTAAAHEGGGGLGLAALVSLGLLGVVGFGLVRAKHARA